MALTADPGLETLSLVGRWRRIRSLPSGWVRPKKTGRGFRRGDGSPVLLVRRRCRDAGAAVKPKRTSGPAGRWRRCRNRVRLAAPTHRTAGRRRSSWPIRRLNTRTRRRRRRRRRRRGRRRVLCHYHCYWSGFRKNPSKSCRFRCYYRRSSWVFRPETCVVRSDGNISKVVVYVTRGLQKSTPKC